MYENFCGYFPHDHVVVVEHVVDGLGLFEPDRGELPPPIARKTNVTKS